MNKHKTELCKIAYHDTHILPYLPEIVGIISIKNQLWDIKSWNQEKVHQVIFLIGVPTSDDTWYHTH